MASTSGPRDEHDWKIIEILREDGRTTNKEIARQLDLSEANVAARIKWLRVHKVMVVTLQRDLYSQGFEFQCAVDVHVKGRKAMAVARDLARIDEVTAVSLLIGKPDIILVCNATDRSNMLDVIHNKIALVKGVFEIAVHTALDIHKYESYFADLVNQ